MNTKQNWYSELLDIREFEDLGIEDFRKFLAFCGNSGWLSTRWSLLTAVEVLILQQHYCIQGQASYRNVSRVTPLDSPKSTVTKRE
ncbi:MAG: hypothetical protein ABIK83_06720 [Candidatus Zixiibacteriota bacterium]